MYSKAKDPYKTKYQLLINKQENVGLIIVMILKLLRNTRMIWVIFVKILISTIPEKNEKH